MPRTTAKPRRIVREHVVIKEEPSVIVSYVSSAHRLLYLARRVEAQSTAVRRLWYQTSTFTSGWLYLDIPLAGNPGAALSAQIQGHGRGTAPKPPKGARVIDVDATIVTAIANP